MSSHLPLFVCCQVTSKGHCHHLAQASLTSPGLDLSSLLGSDVAATAVGRMYVLFSLCISAVRLFVSHLVTWGRNGKTDILRHSGHWRHVGILVWNEEGWGFCTVDEHLYLRCSGGDSQACRTAKDVRSWVRLQNSQPLSPGKRGRQDSGQNLRQSWWKDRVGLPLGSDQACAVLGSCHLTVTSIPLLLPHLPLCLLML